MTIISRRSFLLGAGVTGTLGLIASYPFFIERYLVKINHYSLSVNNLHPDLEDFRILHLSDLHYGSLVPLKWIKHVLSLAQEQKPDLIALTGDYIHERNSRTQLDIIWPELMKLSAPFGVKMVLGNHDHWADSKYALQLLEESGRSLRNRSEILKKGNGQLILGGTGDYWEDDVIIDDALMGQDDKLPRIVLTHNPDSADLPYSVRVDWFLCGHTHGGQVKIPFIGTPVLPVRNKKYNNGIKSNGKSSLFINKGIGWAVFPVRFNCAPEIAVLHLTAKNR